MHRGARAVSFCPPPLQDMRGYTVCLSLPAAIVSPPLSHYYLLESSPLHQCIEVRRGAAFLQASGVVLCSLAGSFASAGFLLR